ncbi:CobW family GTP-binding protein [Maridesulfovibrio salexigens]|uniref:Cobalamin synthesis protein P47K n=1 Tax=Maridesulfovibrio salexigens (strain ATCC 14822 / DSM 2638 / NCIMB 8403 / VKM B-1763) TaxID=526222 RepID=C6BWH8_MARSD|nr:GTP-binding protein [Maridesulfovibrio salexigens]ACS78422.1 cobalamin synthesis protein P47K [Maridesulfovibrio salexigens DSM 2638]
MNLSAILPPRRSSNHQINMPDILVNCLLVACQHDEFKRLLGWKGMAVCPKGKKAWTMKLRTHPGVFGLCAEDEYANDSGFFVSLGLYYFPEENEELLESMSLAANIAVVQKDYIQSIRRFSSDENWAAPFRIATVINGLNREENGFTLKLSADQAKVSISQDGIATQDGQWIINPGEIEESIPAHSIAMDFLLVLAAAVSNSLEVPPCGFYRTETPGHATIYDSMGNKFPSSHEITHITDALNWGEREAATSLAFPQLPDFCAQGDAKTRKDLPTPLADALFWKTNDLAAVEVEGNHNYAFDKRPSLIVLSGFLGAGKTTFLNQLLEYHASRNELVAIIQNEIGQTGVDGKLLEGDDSIVELDEGCVCCTLAGNLSKGIEQLKTRFNPKVIVLETTGLANPFNILNEIETLRPLVRLDSVTTLVDAENGPQLLADSDIARNQVKAADVIILNKCDLVSQEEKESLAKLLTTLNKRALLVNTINSEINPGTIYDSDPRTHHFGGISLCPLTPPQHTHAMEGFTSRRFAFNKPLSREDLNDLMTSLPKEVFRLKGIVKVSGNNAPEVVQYVSGRYELSNFSGEFDDDGFLVAIGRDMELDLLEKLERNYS